MNTRYPGIKPFTTEEQDLFFGRDHDREELFKLIYTQQIVVLYGRSGFGKSSLINAGIVPKLQKAQLPFFKIRFGNYNPEDRSRQLTPAEATGELFASSVVDGLLSNLSPNNQSIWYRIKNFQIQTDVNQFVLLFDQFEELFSYPANQVIDFKQQLSDVLYRIVPDWLLAASSQRIKVLDETDQELLYRKPEIKVVFSIRTDRLALLNELKDFHPAVLRHCYELDALDDDEAIDAIRQPANKEGGYKTPAFEYDPDFIDQILTGIRNVQDHKIETTNLQIVCSTFEKFIVPEIQRQNRQPIILHYNDLLFLNTDSNNIHSAKINTNEEVGIQDIFRSYYVQTLELLKPEEQVIAKKIIEEELVKQGRRLPFALEYLLSRFVGEGLTEELLNKLVATSLLRVERDSQGRMIYELAHDTLVKPVTEYREERKKVEEELERLAEERKRLAEEQARTLEYKVNVLTKQANIRSQTATVIAVMALIASVIATYFYVTAKENAQQIKAYYWAAESAKLPPDQALQLLKAAAAYNLSLPQVYDRIVNEFNRSDSVWFAKSTLRHKNTVYSAVFSADASRILTASFDQTARLWDSQGKLLATLHHKDAVYRAVFSADASRILTASLDSTARLCVG
ncbi:hypothetical protein GO755_28425 [Spirosoma sp. HMF4905]|uniref:Novel STAND NTPase 1 domain-containing protein n=1 Tax=Spirosoma arboris TaxID=2682092 RepID=A0A7K1SJS3_9BACT|nr:hypothetical protein [Spirosoma arboris]MVM33994.1 hypothetical protein [Spirosoma arboris]